MPAICYPCSSLVLLPYGRASIIFLDFVSSSIRRPTISLKYLNCFIFYLLSTIYGVLLIHFSFFRFSLHVSLSFQLFFLIALHFYSSYLSKFSPTSWSPFFSIYRDGSIIVLYTLICVFGEIPFSPIIFLLNWDYVLEIFFLLSSFYFHSKRLFTFVWITILR